MPLLLQGLLCAVEPRVQRAPAAGERPKDPQCQLSVFDKAARKDNRLRTINAPLSVMKVYEDAVMTEVQLPIEEIFYNIEGNSGVSYALIVSEK